MQRDELLALDDENLSTYCDLEFFKATGKGGQKRNKSSSAVRVRLIINDTIVTAEDCSERSQHQNRRNALHKLRRNLAYKIRESKLDNDLVELSCNNKNYYKYVAKLIDIIAANQYSLKESASFLNISTNKLDTIIKKDAHFYQEILHQRATKL